MKCSHVNGTGRRGQLMLDVLRTNMGAQERGRKVYL